MKKITSITNENGTFYCDADSVVGFYERYYSTEYFLESVSEYHHSFNGHWICFDNLVIPDGIRKLGKYFRSFDDPDPYNLRRGLFVGAEIKGELSLPESLRYIGEHSFMGAKIGRVVLPRGLRGISCCAFLRGEIGEVVIPYGFGENIFGGYDEQDEAGRVEVGGRQFKESFIGKLYLPENFNCDVKCALLPEAKIGEIIRY